MNDAGSREMASAADASGAGTAPLDDAAVSDRSTRRAGAVLYPQYYLWFVFLASLDLMFTWIILHKGGSELNTLADWIIQRYQVHGIAVYKFGLVVLVVIICELVGRRRPIAGAKLAKWAVLLTAFPVIIGAIHLLRIVTGRVEPPGLDL